LLVASVSAKDRNGVVTLVAFSTRDFQLLCKAGFRPQDGCNETMNENEQFEKHGTMLELSFWVQPQCSPHAGRM